MTVEITRPIVRRRSMLKGAGGLAGILALGKAPAIAQTQPTKLVIAHITPVPESGSRASLLRALFIPRSGTWCA